MWPLSITINPYVLVTFVCLCAAIIYRYMRETYSVIQKLGIPCPKPIWVFGNAHEMKDKDPLSVFQEWRKVYGDVYGFYEGFRSGVVVHGPDMAEEILNKNFEHFHGRPNYRPFKYYPDDIELINIAGDYWKHLKSVLTKNLNLSSTSKHLVENIERSSCRLTEALEKERDLHPEGFDVTTIIHKFVSNTMAGFVLGLNEEDLRCHGDDLYEFELERNKAASPEHEYVGLAMLFPALAPLLKVFNKKHEQYHHKVCAFLRPYMVNMVAGQNNNDMKQTDHSSLLSQIMSSTVLSRDIDGSLTRRNLTNDELLSHVLMLLNETYTTTASVLSFMLYELARNPKVQEQLYEEICHVCAKETDDKVAELQSMSYFDKVFNETYRLHPSAPGLARECMSDCNIKGVQFKKGTKVRIMLSSMYNDETLFPNPETFDPERFSQENRDARPSFSFLPFGQGPRMCPGYKFASYAMKMTIITILTKYRLTVSDKTEIPLQHAFRPVITAKNGVHIKLEERC